MKKVLSLTLCLALLLSLISCGSTSNDMTDGDDTGDWGGKTITLKDYAGWYKGKSDTLGDTLSLYKSDGTSKHYMYAYGEFHEVSTGKHSVIEKNKIKTEVIPLLAADKVNEGTALVYKNRIVHDNSGTYDKDYIEYKIKDTKETDEDLSGIWQKFVSQEPAATKGPTEAKTTAAPATTAKPTAPGGIDKDFIMYLFVTCNKKPIGDVFDQNNAFVYIFIGLNDEGMIETYPAYVKKADDADTWEEIFNEFNIDKDGGNNRPVVNCVYDSGWATAAQEGFLKIYPAGSFYDKLYKIDSVTDLAKDLHSAFILECSNLMSSAGSFDSYEPVYTFAKTVKEHMRTYFKALNLAPVR